MNIVHTLCAQVLGPGYQPPQPYGLMVADWYEEHKKQHGEEQTHIVVLCMLAQALEDNHPPKLGRKKGTFLVK